jgi:hypothetical protein
MSLYEDVRPLLAARAATDPNAARLLEIFTRADEILSDQDETGEAKLLGKWKMSRINTLTPKLRKATETIWPLQQRHQQVGENPADGRNLTK